MVGMHAILWVEQFWNVHLQKLDREIFEDGPSVKIGSLEKKNIPQKFPSIRYYIFMSLQICGEVLPKCCFGGF